MTATTIDSIVFPATTDLRGLGWRVSALLISLLILARIIRYSSTRSTAEEGFLGDVDAAHAPSIRLLAFLLPVEASFRLREMSAAVALGRWTFLPEGASRFSRAMTPPRPMAGLDATSNIWRGIKVPIFSTMVFPRW